ncbi:hypothetical protein UY3_05722 [Chelonia mydas]|uniref:Uncharacterized protein n=1 Tax=Chelonia mydas TaxID=8469 RepID=M7BH03_CHEMY|nr:hypothetical protein UY3_05722 [Chelonia mydas]
MALPLTPVLHQNEKCKVSGQGCVSVVVLYGFVFGLQEWAFNGPIAAVISQNNMKKLPTWAQLDLKQNRVYLLDTNLQGPATDTAAVVPFWQLLEHSEHHKRLSYHPLPVHYRWYIDQQTARPHGLLAGLPLVHAVSRYQLCQSKSCSIA